MIVASEKDMLIIYKSIYKYNSYVLIMRLIVVINGVGHVCLFSRSLCTDNQT